MVSSPVFSSIQRRRAIQSAIAAALLISAVPAFALDSYVGPNTGGLWNTAANWSPAAIPVIGDDVTLGNFSPARGGIFVDLTLNTSYTGSGLNSLVLDSVNCNTITLNQNSSVNMIAATETIGKSISNNVYNQSAGTNTVTSAFNIALNAGSTGNYNLSGGTLTLSSATFRVGVNGSTGTFTQSGTGSVVILGSDLSVGDSGTANGVYNLNGGSISASNNEDIGGSGVGTFNQTAGINNVSSGFLFLGGGLTNTATGTYNLSGTAASTLTTTGEVYGNSNLNTGNGNFFQSGGVHTVGAQGLHITSGNYTLTGGTLITTTGYLDLGETASKTSNFTQNGGTANLSTIFLGDAANATGNYSLLSGSLTSGFTQIGNTNGGIGNFTQSGGTHLVTSQLILGLNNGTTGAYNLSGTAAVTLTAPEETIGSVGTGIFSQSGGVNTVTSLATSQVVLAGGDGSIGEYVLSGGTLKSVQTVVADHGIAIFVQTGGAVQLQQFGGQNGNLLIGNSSNGNGTYELIDNASLNPTLTAASESVGVAGLGLFSQQGGSNSVSSDISLATAASSNGTYQLLSGSIFTLNLNVGVAGNGTFTPSGGNTSVSGTFTVGSNVGAIGTVSLSGTANITAVAEQIGDKGTGVFNQSGGLNSLTPVNGHIIIGGVGTGTYNLSGNGTLTVLNATNSLLNSQTGTFHQTGGTFNGYFTNQGVYTFDAGTFNGILDNRSVGTVNVNGNLTSAAISSFGTVNISINGSLLASLGGFINNYNSVNLLGGSIGGSGLLTNYGTISGFGIFTGSGSFANDGLIIEGAGPLSFLSNLTVNNADIQLAPGRLVSIFSTTFNNYGSIEVGGSTITGNAITNNIGATLTGPGLVINSLTNFGTVNPGTGTLNLSNTWTNNGLILLLNSPSTLTGAAITNNSTIQGTGLIGAPITNAGMIEALGGTLTLSNTLSNNLGATFVASTGNKLLLSAGLATNAGLLSLTGGTIDNNNHALNNTGQITGYGTLRTGGVGLTNNGSFTLTGGITTINGNVTNSSGKSIEVKFNPAIFTGNIVNNGTIKTTSTTVTFAGGFTNNAFYLSDPSTNIFQSNINNGGTMTGGVGDVFIFLSGSVTNTGTFNNAGTLQSADNINNSGTFTQTGPQTWSNNTTFTNSGNATLTTDTGTNLTSPLSILNTAGKLLLSTPQHLNALNITGGNVTLPTSANPRQDTGIVLKTSSLSIGSTSTLDITNHDLILGNANLITTQNEILNGIGLGPGGAVLTSSTANAAGNLFLIPLDATTFGISSWDNVAVTDPNSIIVKFTYFGDANLDGLVDGNDFSVIAGNFHNTTPGIANIQQSWLMGDVNLDGFVDGNDFSVVAGNFGAILLTTPASNPITPTNVPEPASLALLGLSAAFFTAKRRRQWN